MSLTPYQQSVAAGKLRRWEANKDKPKAASYGFAGCYKGCLNFRSLHELYFVTELMEPLNKKWVSVDRDPMYAVPYLNLQNEPCNYFPDFIVLDDKIVYEIKPDHLRNDALVLRKKAAAEEHFKKMGFRYLITSAGKIEPRKIAKLYEDGDIVFTGDDLIAFKQYYDKIKRETFNEEIGNDTRATR